MASIDGFLELADGGFHPPVQTRFSQRLLPPRHANATRDPTAVRERRLTLAFVIAVDVVLLLALRWAMQPPPVARRVEARPQLVFITLPRAVAPVPAVTKVAPHDLHAPSPPTRSPPPARALPARGALQAVLVPPAKAVTTVPPAANIRLYSTDGRLLLPPPPAASSSRDLLAHQNSAGLLPGGYLPHRVDMPVQAAKIVKVVQGIQAFTGGGPYDPCPDLSAQMAKLDDPDAIARAESHYEQACEGH